MSKLNRQNHPGHHYAHSCSNLQVPKRPTPRPVQPIRENTWPYALYVTAWAIFNVIIVAVILSLVGCTRTPRYIPVEKVLIDSVTVRDTVFQQQLIPYRDSVTVAPAGADTASYLSNPYAYSWARWKGGHLHHSLGIFTQATVTVRVPYFIDRYVYRSEPQIVEVEKKLTRWQHIKMTAGGYALFLIGIAFIAILFRLYRWIKGKI